MARILIAVDGSPASQRALEFGASLGAKLSMGVTLLHVVPQVVLPMGGGGPETLAKLRLVTPGRGHPAALWAWRTRPSPADGVAVATEQALGEPAVVIHERSQARWTSTWW